MNIKIINKDHIQLVWSMKLNVHRRERNTFRGVSIDEFYTCKIPEPLFRFMGEPRKIFFTFENEGVVMSSWKGQEYNTLPTTDRIVVDSKLKTFTVKKNRVFSVSKQVFQLPANNMMFTLDIKEGKPVIYVEEIRGILWEEQLLMRCVKLWIIWWNMDMEIMKYG